jgi:O-antigen/teichoic acid export membrane protein
VVDEPKATSAGRGVLYIAFAKFYFLLVGLAISFGLPSIISTEAFGQYGLVNNITSMFNNVAVTGTIQSVSRFATQSPGKARMVQRAGLRMHLWLGLPVALAFVAAAPLVAWLLNDPSKTAPLMLAGAIIAGYSFYAVFVGTANGTHQFHKQAGLDITFGTLRAAGLLGMAALGAGVIGVIGGWVGAVALILCVAMAWVGLPGKPAERMPVRPLVRYFGGVAVYLLLFNALMFVDNGWLERLIGVRIGADAADQANGYYTAVQYLSRVSYQLMIAATFVVFPLVSRSTFTDDRETTRRYIRITTRYALMFATLIAVVLASNPHDVMRLMYRPDYADAGAPALPLLAFGYVGYTVFSIGGTILNGGGRSRAAIWSAAITLALAVLGNYEAISTALDHAHGDRVLEIAAAVTGGAMLFGAVLTCWQLHRAFGASVPAASLVRIAIACGGAYAVGRYVPLHDKGKVMTLVELAVVAIAFLVLLVATGELGRRDLEAIKAARRKRGSEGQP